MTAEFVLLESRKCCSAMLRCLCMKGVYVFDAWWCLKSCALVVSPYCGLNGVLGVVNIGTNWQRKEDGRLFVLHCRADSYPCKTRLATIRMSTSGLLQYQITAITMPVDMSRCQCSGKSTSSSCSKTFAIGNGCSAFNTFYFQRNC